MVNTVWGSNGKYPKDRYIIRKAPRIVALLTA
jgi:hypothetical protein